MIPLSRESVNRMTQRSGLSLQQLLTDRNLALQPLDDGSSNSSNAEDTSDSNPDDIEVVGTAESEGSARTEAVSETLTAAAADDPTDRLLKDVTAAADICRCNPCRCDPLLNDCSVSCNPVVEEQRKEDGGCCGSKKSAGSGCCGGGGAAKNKSSSSGCPCSGRSETAAASADPLEVVESSEPPDALDPCCIVVCLKHLKQQFRMERPKCCA